MLFLDHGLVLAQQSLQLLLVSMWVDIPVISWEDSELDIEPSLDRENLSIQK